MKRKTAADHKLYTKENRMRMHVEEHERENVSIQHLSPRHDDMPVKKKESNIIDSVSSLTISVGLL